MSAVQPATPLLQLPTPPKGRKLFHIKGEYGTCHITVPDVTERLPAVIISGQMYSFLKSVKSREKALDIVEKLFDSGEDAIITQSKKAYSIWVYEPEAAPVMRK
jgi:hypothetical protein